MSPADGPDILLQGLSKGDGESPGLPWWALILILSCSAAACLLLCVITRARRYCCPSNTDKAPRAPEPVLDPDPDDNPPMLP